MSVTSAANLRVLVLAPDRDARAVQPVLAAAALPSTFCVDLQDVRAQLDNDTGALVLTEEMLAGDGLGRLADALGLQPAWSDLPLVLLAGRGADSPPALRALDIFENITLVEWPAPPAVLASVLKSALRARRRQYELRDQRRLEQRQAIQLAVTQVLAEKTTAEEALTGILQAVCERLEWSVGAIWSVDPQAGRLRCAGFWHRPNVSVPEFEAICRQRPFERGVGLPGRVWSSGQPAWIPDVVEDTNFPRAPVAVREDLHGAFGFPIRLGREVLGVIEFFSKEIEEPDDDLLVLMTNIGVSIGQFLDRKRVEASLRTSEQRFAQFMQHLAGLAWIKDLEGRYVYANDAALKAFRTPRERLFGKTDEEVFPPETAAQFRDNDRRALRSETGIQTVETLADENGVVRHSLVHKFPIPAGDGKPAMVGGMAIDITELRRAEEVQALLATVVECSADAIVSKTLDGVILSWNAGAERIFGYTAKEAIGRHITLIIPRERHDEDRLIQERIHRGERIEHYETVRLAKDGRLLNVSLTVSPLRDRSGRIIGASKIGRDVTLQKQAQEALRQSEERFRFLAETIPSMVWTANPEGVITYANRRWLDYCGLTAEENARDWPTLVLHPDDHDRCVAEWNEALRQGQEYEIEVRNRRHDGVYRWFVTRASPLRDSQGRVAAWFGVTTDIHDQKEMQERLREADRRKNEFLAMLAHELRNPLAPIRNSLHILRLGGAEAASPQLIAMMDRQIDHMVRLVDDLLEVSRITRGKIALRKAPVELAAVLRSAVETSRPHIESARHQLSVSLPPEPVILEADAVRLAQIVANLLNNAAKYTDEGGQIWLSARRDGSDVVISVRDTGMGISAGMLPRIFDLFTQGERSRDRSQGGLGIGLTLVHSLVQQHGGSVTAQSDGPGKGSEFIVRLPALPPGQEIRAVTPRPESAGTAIRRILVVDDNVDAAQSLGRLLQVLGHEVRLAHDGSAALEAAGDFRPNVILLDIDLPVMDGYEVARRLRGAPDLAHVQLIALTGYGQEADRLRSREAGFDDHLVKPLELASLQALLGGP